MPTGNDTKLDHEFWRVATEIFTRVLDAAPAERAGLMRELCGADFLLQEEVESLMAHDCAAADLDPVFQAAAEEIVSEAEPDDDEPESKGTAGGL